MSTTTKTLQVVVNGTSLLTYDRSIAIPAEQQTYLKTMDARMDAGIELNGKLIKRPDMKQRSQFVANEMINALYHKEQATAIAMCTWLGERTQNLSEVKAQGDIRQNMRVDLIFNRLATPRKTEPMVKPNKLAKV